MRSKTLNCLALAALSTLVTTSLLATSVIPMSVEQLTHSASIVIEARALRSHSQWNPQHTIIYTYTQFQVSRSLKGSAPNLITVRQLGGSAGGYTQKVSGVHGWRNGEEAVLFLRPSEAGNGVMAVVGLMQGIYRVERLTSGERRVSNGMPHTEAYLTGGGSQQVIEPSTSSLKDLEHRVRRAVQQ